MKKNLYILILMFCSLFGVQSCQTEQVIMENGHEAVDLGLPSGTLWATCNVGASTPEEGGGTFAYGEVETKDVYEWANYKLVQVDEEEGDSKYIKYNSSRRDGPVDNLMDLLPEDDPASVAWGGGWRTPTMVDAQELIAECEFKYEKRDKTEGFVVTGPNGHKIFMPFTPPHEGNGTWENSGVFLRTSTITRDGAGSSDHAWLIKIYNRADVRHSYRYIGVPVRPVCVMKDGKITAIEKN